MKRDHTDLTDVEPHVFDQTNGVVDLGASEPVQPTSDDVRTGKPDNRTVAGIAMMSVKRP
jgi:hypothetical protein